jgi:hypothetical protein
MPVIFCDSRLCVTGRNPADETHWTHSMENLVPRLIGKSEASRLGVLAGWYGTKVSGTFVTGPCASLATCIEAIDSASEMADAGTTASEPIQHMT